MPFIKDNDHFHDVLCSVLSKLKVLRLKDHVEILLAVLKCTTVCVYNLAYLFVLKEERNLVLS